MRYFRSVNWKRQIDLLIRDVAVIATSVLWVKLVQFAWETWAR